MKIHIVIDLDDTPFIDNPLKDLEKEDLMHTLTSYATHGLGLATDEYNITVVYE